MNHSCNPNCITQKWVIGKKMRIGIFMSRAITAGEELTFDYKSDI
jgi:SET domain-containing protein